MPYWAEIEQIQEQILFILSKSCPYRRQKAAKSRVGTEYDLHKLPRNVPWINNTNYANWFYNKLYQGKRLGGENPNDLLENLQNQNKLGNSTKNL